MNITFFDYIINVIYIIYLIKHNKHKILNIELDRCQFLCTHAFNSKFIAICFGLPQSYIFDASVFLVYINKILQIALYKSV